MPFDRQRRWSVCNHNERTHHHEVRANAFASEFLTPATGVRRYLQSIGRDTMAQRLGGELEVLCDSASVPPDESRVRVSARSRRGNWEFNACELSQVASYFGVTTSLAAHGLAQSEEGREYHPFVSRLLGLATEGWRRGALSDERIKSIVVLLNEEDRAQLFGNAGFPKPGRARRPGATKEARSRTRNDDWFGKASFQERGEPM